MKTRPQFVGVLIGVLLSAVTLHALGPVPGSDNYITTSLINGMPTVSVENANFRITYNAADVLNLKVSVPGGATSAKGFEFTWAPGYTGPLNTVAATFSSTAAGTGFNVALHGFTSDSTGTRRIGIYAQDSASGGGLPPITTSVVKSALWSDVGNGGANIFTGSRFGSNAQIQYEITAIGNVIMGDHAGVAIPGSRSISGEPGLGTDIVGGNLTLLGGTSTGAGTPSSVIIQSTTAGGTSSTAQTPFAALTIAAGGDLRFNRTVTAIGTTGAQTINKATGTINVAAGQSSVDLTNSLVTTDTIAQASLAVADSTCTFIKSIVPTTGHLVFTLNGNCNATQSIRWIVTN